MKSDLHNVAIESDMTGIIVNVIYDGWNPQRSITLGKNFTNLIDINSLDKAKQFLELMQEHGFALNWELNVQLQKSHFTMFFLGICKRGKCLIIGIQSLENLAGFVDELFQTYPEQLTPYSSAITALSLHTTQTNTAIYDELSSLNNMLMNTQRTLTKTNFELKAQRDLYHITLASIADAVITTDVKGDIVFLNPVATHLTEWQHDEAIGKTLSDVLVIQNEHLQRVLASIETVDHPLSHRDDIRLIKRNGETFPIELSLTPLQSQQNHILGFVLVFRDISSQQLLEQQNIELVTERERNHALSALIQGTSHEFRTTLAIMTSSLYLMKRKKDDAGFQEKYQGRLQTQVSRMTDFIEKLTTMAELDTLTPTMLNKDSVNLAEGLEIVLSNLQSQIEMKQVQVHKNPDPFPPYAITGDSHMLGIALSNIIKNAIFYTPQQGSIFISTGRDDNTIWIEIRDTGVGIESEHFPYIFDRFYRVDPSRSNDTGGFGLGLFIARQIVTLHGGTIQVDSIVEQGTSFTIVLPG